MLHKYFNTFHIAIIIITSLAAFVTNFADVTLSIPYVVNPSNTRLLVRPLIVLMDALHYKPAENLPITVLLLMEWPVLLCTNWLRASLTENIMVSIEINLLTIYTV